MYLPGKDVEKNVGSLQTGRKKFMLRCYLMTGERTLDAAWGTGGELYIYIYMGVSENRGFSPQIIPF